MITTSPSSRSNNLRMAAAISGRSYPDRNPPDGEASPLTNDGVCPVRPAFMALSAAPCPCRSCCWPLDQNGTDCCPRLISAHPVCISGGGGGRCTPALLGDFTPVCLTSMRFVP
jgi:hypothetical protein